MNLIDTFLYVWQSDTKGFTKGQEEVDKGVDKTIDKLSEQDKALKASGENFLALAGKVAGLVAAYASWQAVKSAAMQAADDTNVLAEQAQALRVNADELRTWKGAIMAAGGTAEGLTATIKTLSERTRDPLLALEKVADRFKGLTDQQANRLGKSLGIDESLVRVMQQGTAALQERLKRQMQLGSVTQEQIDIANKYKLVLQDTNTVYDDVRRRIMTWVLPAMIEWEKTMQNIVMWLRDNSTFVFTFFGTMATLIMARVLPAIIAMGVQWLRTSALFLASPLGLAIAAVVALSAAIALVVDDIMAFEEGGKSLIGDIAQRWPIIGVVVHNIVDAIKMLWEIGRAVFQYLKDVIYEPAKALDNLKVRLTAVFDAMSARFPIMGGLVKGFASIISSFVGGAIKVFETLFDIVSKVWRLIADSPIGKVVGAVVEKAKDALSTAEDPKTMERYNLPTAAEIEKQRAAAADPTKAAFVTGRRRQAGQKSVADYALPAAPEAQKQKEAAAAGAAAGKEVVAKAQANPLNSTSSNAITNSAVTNNRTSSKTVNLNGAITIEAKGADAATVQKSVGAGLGTEIKKAMDNFDDGVAI